MVKLKFSMFCTQNKSHNRIAIPVGIASQLFVDVLITKNSYSPVRAIPHF
jgi:hypothetical protein